MPIWRAGPQKEIIKKYRTVKIKHLCLIKLSRNVIRAWIFADRWHRPCYLKVWVWSPLLYMRKKISPDSYMWIAEILFGQGYLKTKLSWMGSKVVTLVNTECSSWNKYFIEFLQWEHSKYPIKFHIHFVLYSLVAHVLFWSWIMCVCEMAEFSNKSSIILIICISHRKHWSISEQHVTFQTSAFQKFRR